MKENDIAVKLDALSSGSYKLGRAMSDIEQLATQLRRNMSYVGKEFDSVNFERADNVVQEVIVKLRQTSDELQRVRSFLKGLEEKAEIYLGCKYTG